MPCDSIVTKNESRTTKMVKILKIICAILEIILIVTLAILYDITRPVKDLSVIQIQKGASYRSIISDLSKDKINTTFLDAKILSFFKGVQYGILEVKYSTNKIDFLYNLSKAKQKMQEIVLIPGETAVVFLKDLADKFDLSYDKLIEYHNKLVPFEDGFLVPETYKFSKISSEKSIIEAMVSFSNKFHKNLCEQYFEKCDDDVWKKVLIKASIIQKESANIQEMELVSSVIDNRLKKNMKLQMDGALNYGIYSHVKVTPQRIKNDKTSFNTYENFGLPDYPVCAVSKNAIKAAINPANTDYLYFVLDRAQNSHLFSKTYNEHINNIKKVKK